MLIYCIKRRYSVIVLYLTWINIFVIKGSEVAVWQNLTACYGSDNRCSQYQIQCPLGQTIVLGEMMYAAKTDTQCQIGISDCNQTDSVARCCTYDQNDKFTRFSAGNMTSLLENCEGQNSCAGWAPRSSMFPYSSYVWIQYACIDEKNLAELCTKHQVIGNNLFLKWNGSDTMSTSSHSEIESCSCVVTASNCNASIMVTFVDLDFQHSIQNASGLLQNMPSLHLYHANATFNYLNTQAYIIGVDRMKRIQIDESGEIIGLRNLNNNDNGPEYIMIHIAATLDTITLDCYSQGQQARFSNHCDYSTTINPSSTTELTSSTPGITSDNEATQSNELNSTLSNTETTSSIHQPHITMSTKLPSAITEPNYITFDQTPLVHQTTKLTDQPKSTYESSSFVKTTETVSPSNLQSSASPVSTMSSFSQQPAVSLSSPKLDNRITSTKPNILSAVTSDPQHHSGNTENTLRTTSITEEIQTSFARPNASFGNVSQFLPTETVTSRGTGGSSSSETTSTGSVKVSNAFKQHTVNSTSSDQNVVIKETTKIHTGTVISVTNINHHTTETNADDGGSNGLIIGITVAVVVTVLIVIMVFVVCFCVRLKRKETIRRNYIRNTNIFYSFPEDYNDTGSTNAGSPDVDASNLSFVPDDNEENTYSSARNKTVRLDQYKIKNTKQNFPIDIYNKDTTSNFVMPNDNSCTGETSTETIDFVDDKETVDDNFNTGGLQNALKSVTFDPSVHYAKVNKEGKTKF